MKFALKVKQTGVVVLGVNLNAREHTSSAVRRVHVEIGWMQAATDTERNVMI